MNKRQRNKQRKRFDLVYTEWMLKEEQTYNLELTDLIEQCLQYIPDGNELRTKIKNVVDALNV